MVPQWIIEKKRDGGILTRGELREFIEAYTRGDLPDYQMAAFAMAVFFRGLTGEETAALTEAMMRSGDVVDTSALAAPKVDKHSTGGIGDKVSLVLAPLLAACGLAVPMVSGRGLGITGGTLDKLESIPGFRTDLSEPEFLAVLRECGCSMIGQTGRIAPADRKLYALRDVTGTVPSVPLITASILSKKLAEGIDVLVLDVKCGRGAFMKTRAEARALAESLIRVGRGMGASVSALVTDMNQPLGRSVGNALEVIESAEALRGRGPDDLMELTFALCSELLCRSGRAGSADDARARLRARLDDGSAFRTFRRMVALQGGDPDALEEPGRLPRASLRVPLPAPAAGIVAEVQADRIGQAGLLLGAGRRAVDDRIDPAVGLSDLVKIGTPVERGSTLAVLHANDARRAEEAQRLLRDAFVLSDRPVERPPLILERLDG